MHDQIHILTFFRCVFLFFLLKRKYIANYKKEYTYQPYYFIIIIILTQPYNMVKKKDSTI